LTAVTAGRVGRAHGRDGSFYVDEPDGRFAKGTTVAVDGVEREIERRAGTDERPLVRLAGVSDRSAAEALRGLALVVERPEVNLEEDEYVVSDLVGCSIDGLGYVERVLAGPSCDVLEVGHDGVLVPLVSDAIRRVDLERRVIEIDRDFLGLDP
jgi:16S rRNA processing protein RimM